MAFVERNFNDVLFDDNQADYKRREKRVKQWLESTATKLCSSDRERREVFAPYGRSGEPNYASLASFIRRNAVYDIPPMHEVIDMRRDLVNIIQKRNENNRMAAEMGDQGHVDWVVDVLWPIREDLTILSSHPPPRPVRQPRMLIPAIGISMAGYGSAEAAASLSESVSAAASQPGRSQLGISGPNMSPTSSMASAVTARTHLSVPKRTRIVKFQLPGHRLLALDIYDSDYEAANEGDQNSDEEEDQSQQSTAQQGVQMSDSSGWLSSPWLYLTGAAGAAWVISRYTFKFWQR